MNNLVSASNTALGTKVQFFSLNNAQSANLAARTHDASEILHSRTNTATTGTKADDFNLVYMKRTSVQNGVDGTFTQAGSVLKLENVATQTAGTLTDTVDVLRLVQSSTISTGNIIQGYKGATAVFTIDKDGNFLTI